MMVLLGLVLFGTVSMQALELGSEPDACLTIHGRAHLYIGDGQIRIWQVGTKHEYKPDASSWQKVQGWLEAGSGDAAKSSDGAASGPPAVAFVYLFGDFLVCPTEPYKEGSVQEARIVRVTHRRYSRHE
jgi:hypothetical protein